MFVWLLVQSIPVLLENTLSPSSGILNKDGYRGSTHLVDDILKEDREGKCCILQLI